ncbi:MAG: ATP-binding protein [bacterium]
MFLNTVKRKNISIKRIFAVILALTLLCLGAVLTAYSISLQKKILIDELKKRGDILVQSLADSCVLSLLRNDDRQLRELTHSVTKDAEIIFAEILNNDLELLAGFGHGTRIAPDSTQHLLDLKEVFISHSEKLNFYDFYCPILIEGYTDEESKDILLKGKQAAGDQSIERIMGVARLGISTKQLTHKIAGIAFRGILLTIIMIFIIGIIINYIVNLQIIQPLRKLTLAAVTASHGDLRQEVDIDSSNEIGVLARAFNLMVHDLRESQTKLEQSIYKLEDKVKERTQQLETLTQELQKKNKQLIDTDKIKSNFMKIVSREIRSPLASIHGYSSTLVHKGDALTNDTKSKYLNIIETESGRMAGIVDNLIDFTLIESHEFNITWNTLNIPRLIRVIIQDLEDEFETIRFQLNMNDSFPSVEADEQKISKVIRELLRNAAIYSPSGGTVRVDGEQLDKTVTIRIIDSGIGIPSDEKNKIFDQFYRVDNKINKKHIGTGLGLLVARTIVTLHGGKLWVDDAPKGGSQFIIELPIERITV